MEINRIEQQTPTILTEAPPQHTTKTNKRLWMVCLQIFALTIIIGSLVAGGIVGALVTPYAALLGIIGIVISLVWLSAILIARKQKQFAPPTSEEEVTNEVMLPKRTQPKPLYDFFSTTAQDLDNTLEKNFIKSSELPPSITVQGVRSVLCYTNKTSEDVKLISIQTALGEQLQLLANGAPVTRLALIPPEIPEISLLQAPYHNASLSSLALSTGSSWADAVSLLSDLAAPRPGAWILGTPVPEDTDSPPVIMMWNPFGFYPDVPPYDLMTTHPLHRFTSFESLHTFFYESLKRIADMNIRHVALPIFDFLTPRGFSNLPYNELIQTDIDQDPEPRVLLALVTAMNSLAAENSHSPLVVYSYSPQYNAVDFFSKAQ